MRNCHDATAEGIGVVDVTSSAGSSMQAVVFFFFQAEDGIRDLTVTGVQTCALPISCPRLFSGPAAMTNPAAGALTGVLIGAEISNPLCIVSSPVKGDTRRPNPEETQPRTGQIEGVDAHCARR